MVINLNCSGGLSRTLASLVGAHFDRYQVLVIDGGSSDSSLETIRHYSALLPIQWLSRPDQGIYDAMNSAVALIPNEDYVVFLGSGDCLLDHEALIELTDCLSSCRPSWLIAPVSLTSASGKTLGVPKGKRYSPQTLAMETFKWCHQGVFMRRELIEEFGGFDTEFLTIADFDLILRIQERHPPVIWESPITTHQDGGISTRHLYRQAWYKFRLRHDKCDFTTKQVLASVTAYLLGTSRLLVASTLRRIGLGDSVLSMVQRRRYQAVDSHIG